MQKVSVKNVSSYCNNSYPLNVNFNLCILILILEEISVLKETY